MRAAGDAGPYGSESGAVSKFENISKRTDISTSRAGATRGGITNNIKNHEASQKPPLRSNGAAHYRAERGSGSGKRSTSDSLRNLFVPRLQSDKRKSKNRWFLAAFLHPFAAEGKRMSRRSAKYSRRRQTCRTRVQPAIGERKTGRRDASPCVVRDRSREKRPAPGARNTFFTSYHKSTNDCNARSAFPAAGHCI